MNWMSLAVWGFAATVVLTSLLASTRAVGWTRMDIPFLLGTAFSTKRDQAKWIGALVHLMNGWLFAIVYVAAFESVGLATAWFGAMIGFVHSLFVLTVGMTVLPSLHPRMADEEDGPSPTRMLEPPGFLALHYGRQTPFATVVSHLIYGGILGHFYRLAS
jgi:hypothetical protein